MLPATATSASVLTRYSSADGQQAAGSSRSGKWAMAVAAAGGLASGSLAFALCDDAQERQPQPKPPRRRVTKGVADPMTSYEMYAMKRQQEEGGAPNRPAAAADASVQATSAVDVSAVPPPADRMTPSEQSLEESARKAKQHSGGLKLFSGNGNMSLALEIARHLGINLGKSTVGRFADGEVNVVIHENVRGKDVYIIQPTCPPVNDNIMELLLMISTLRRASARRITVVIPYYGYARQDRKMQVRKTRRCGW